MNHRFFIAGLILLVAFVSRSEAQTPQVQVNATIISVPMDSAALRGAGLTLDSVEGVSNRGIIPANQAAVLLSKLETMRDYQLLGTPATVAESGARSRIESSREFSFPSDYSPASLAGGDGKPVVFPSGQAITVLPAAPKSYELRQLGFNLEFESLVAADGSSIDLNLAAELVSFEGFINYGSPIKAAAADKDGRLQEVTLAGNPMLRPVFSRVNNTTKVTIADGHVLVLGQAGSGIEPPDHAEDEHLHRPDAKPSRAVFFFIQAKSIEP